MVGMTRPVEQHGCALAASAYGCLRVVVSEDPRPDTVEGVLNVCPAQAFSFGEFVHHIPDNLQICVAHRANYTFEERSTAVLLYVLCTSTTTTVL